MGNSLATKRASQRKGAKVSRKATPESARDMWWAQQQTAGIVNAMHKKAENTPKEGALSSTEVSVRPSKYSDAIEVRGESWYYGNGGDGNSGWPLCMEVDWEREMTFEQFRSSEWWEPYIERTRNLDFDSSWMDSFSVAADDKYAEIRLTLPVYKKTWWCSSEVPTGEVIEYYLCIGDDGEVEISRGDEHARCITVDEILDAVKFFGLAQEFGVSISDDGTVTIRNGGNDADRHEGKNQTE